MATPTLVQMTYFRTPGPLKTKIKIGHGAEATNTLVFSKCYNEVCWTAKLSVYPLSPEQVCTYSS